MWTLLTLVSFSQGFMRETDRLKRQLEEQKKSADAAANEAVDDLLAVISERETAELKLKVSVLYLKGSDGAGVMLLPYTTPSLL